MAALGALDAAYPSAPDANLISASTRQQLQALDDPPPARPLPDPSLGKRSASSAELPDRASASQAASDDSHMAVDDSADDNPSTLVILMRVDGEHVKGNLDIEDLIPVVQKDVKQTQECLAKSNSMVEVQSQGVNIINFVHCGATGVLLTFKCPFTAEATRSRHANGGLKVREYGELVEYKAVCGRVWCKAAQEKEAKKKVQENCVCVVIRSVY
jgi:hypothetical protein